MHIGEEEAIALPQQSVGVAVEWSFVVMLIGYVNLEELVAECAFVVIDAD